MRVHLLTFGSTIAEDLDVVAMLREDGHVLVDDPEGADVVAVWNPKNRPLAVVQRSRPAPFVAYSLHSLRQHLGGVKT